MPHFFFQRSHLIHCLLRQIFIFVDHISAAQHNRVAINLRPLTTGYTLYLVSQLRNQKLLDVPAAIHNKYIIKYIGYVIHITMSFLITALIKIT
jgi:hypothetical protein